MALLALLPMAALIFGLSLIFSLLLFPLFRLLFHRLFVENHELEIIEIFPDKDEKAVAKLIDKIDFKAAIEISVRHLGKDVEYYMVVPRVFLERAKKFVKEVLPNARFKKTEDYPLFNYSGVTLAKAVVAESENQVRDIDFGKIDFSKVNEVGEGAVVQVVHTPRVPGVNFEIRILSSAPSEYQAREIMDAIADSGFKGIKVREPKDKVKFIHTINFREHSFGL
ncbi:MAG TPA: hypothetical protein PLH22_02155 [Candidatus Colwellbacteria bacterium]|nr:hypothetical protein [Candidatus Colwellbacteria bacterium]